MNSTRTAGPHLGASARFASEDQTVGSGIVPVQASELSRRHLAARGRPGERPEPNLSSPSLALRLEFLIFMALWLWSAATGARAFWNFIFGATSGG